MADDAGHDVGLGSLEAAHHIHHESEQEDGDGVVVGDEGLLSLDEENEHRSLHQVELEGEGGGV